MLDAATADRLQTRRAATFLAGLERGLSFPAAGADKRRGKSLAIDVVMAAMHGPVPAATLARAHDALAVLVPGRATRRALWTELTRWAQVAGYTAGLPTLSQAW